MTNQFPYAPKDWSETTAIHCAKQESLDLTDDHWEVIRSLQEYFSKNQYDINLRELNDALEEKFNTKGGLKYLYTLFPRGPITQGCILSGLELPPDVIDKGFSSAM